MEQKTYDNNNNNLNKFYKTIIDYNNNTNDGIDKKVYDQIILLLKEQKNTKKYIHKLRRHFKDVDAIPIVEDNDIDDRLFENNNHQNNNTKKEEENNTNDDESNANKKRGIGERGSDKTERIRTCHRKSIFDQTKNNINNEMEINKKNVFQLIDKKMEEIIRDRLIKAKVIHIHIENLEEIEKIISKDIANSRYIEYAKTIGDNRKEKY